MTPAPDRAAEVARLLEEHDDNARKLGRISAGARHDNRPSFYLEHVTRSRAAILAIVRELESRVVELERIRPSRRMIDALTDAAWGLVAPIYLPPLSTTTDTRTPESERARKREAFEARVREILRTKETP